MIHRAYLLAALGLLSVATSRTIAQTPDAGAGRRPTSVASGFRVSVSGGAMGFDASGTGWAPVLALRAERELGRRWALAEGSLAYAPMLEQFSDRRTHLGIAEIQLQAQLPLGPVRPYLGVGGGSAVYVWTDARGREPFHTTVSAASGLRASLPRGFGARAELRLRSWTSETGRFIHVASEATLGFSRAF